jgi:hypothetical protein
MGTDLVPYSPPPEEQYQETIPHIKKGKDGGGRGSLLDDPELIELFARGVADGWPTSKFVEMFHVSDRTVRNYKKDPRVRHAALKFQQERVLLITSRTDREIERRLLDSHEIDTVDLIRLRKEFLGGLMRIQAESGSADDRTVTDAMDMLEGDPDMAAKLLDVLGGRKQKETAGG